MRRSMANHKNPQLGNWTRWGQTRSNTAFFREALLAMRGFDAGDGCYAIGLVGSRDLPGICLRRAQSVLRHDQRPSFWSHAFVITSPWDGKRPIKSLTIAEVPFFARNGEFHEPANNAVIRSTTLGHYLNREQDPNVALFAVTRPQGEQAAPLGADELATLAAGVRDPNIDRDRFDFWQGLGVWQQYFWSAEQLPNPVLSGNPVPATAFIEMLFEQIGVDLTPAASERNSAPEHLWTYMRWWLQPEVQNSRGTGGPIVKGCYVIRDEGASVMRHHD